VVGVARNGEEAVQQVQQLKPDVVTMDVEMPGMTGLQALQQIMSKIPCAGHYGEFDHCRRRSRNPASVGMGRG
jgi:YesN/AraC family two-component response regulator